MAGKLRAPSLQRLHDIFDFSPETVSEAEVQAGMPQFSQPPADSVYKPINMPVDRDVGLQDIPPGFAITEEGVRDPQGKPAKFRSPSVGQVLSKLGTDILPVAGGTLPALAKGAIGAANGVDKLANGFTTGAGPIRAYHGSPHNFDKFDLSKIGTGEGAQAYGHGLYFAENPKVAEGYREALTSVGGQQAIFDMANRLRAQGGDAMQNFEAWRAGHEYGNAPAWQKHFDNVREAVAQGRERPGSVYEVGIHADPERFLDWDKPLSAQSQAVRASYHRVVPPGLEPKSGRRAYEFAARDPSTAATRLNEVGIPGIKYLDQGSRGAGDGSRNYVTFSDNIVEILRKYGLAGVAPALPAAAAGAGAAGTLAMIGQGEQPAKPEFNDFVERARREAKEAPPAKKRPDQKPVPAVLGIRG